MLNNEILLFCHTFYFNKLSFRNHKREGVYKHTFSESSVHDQFRN